MDPASRLIMAGGIQMVARVDPGRQQLSALTHFGDRSGALGWSRVPNQMFRGDKILSFRWPSRMLGQTIFRGTDEDHARPGPCNSDHALRRLWWISW
jgi:hypothetical protein